MTKTKTFLTVMAALCCVSEAAQAQLVIQPTLNIAPAPVYEPAPAYYPAPVISTWDPHHRRHDYEYWHNRRAQEHFRR